MSFVKSSKALVIALIAVSAASAEAAEMSLRLLGAESQVSVDKAKSSPVRGYGAGLGVTTEIADSLKVGGTLNYLEYRKDHGEGRPEFKDWNAGVEVRYALVKTESFSIETLTGASYHVLDFKDEVSDGVKYRADKAGLWNYEAGIAGTYSVAENVNLGLEYRYSDTFRKDDVHGKASNVSDSVGYQLRDVALQSDQVAMTLSYAF